MRKRLLIACVLIFVVILPVSAHNNELQLPETIIPKFLQAENMFEMSSRIEERTRNDKFTYTDVNINFYKAIKYYDEVLKYAKEYTELLNANPSLKQLSPKYVDIKGIDYIYYKRARAYVAMEEFDRGLADYNTAIRMSGKSIYFYYRALLHFKSGNYINVLNDTDIVLTYPSGLESVYILMAHGLRGRAYNQLGQYQNALSEYNFYLKSGGSKSDFVERILVLSRLNQFQQGLLELEKTMKRFPPATKEDYLLRAELLRKLKKFDLAMQAYKQALNLDSKYSLAFDGIGFLYQNLDKCKEATTAWAKACQLGSKSSCSRKC